MNRKEQCHLRHFATGIARQFPEEADDAFMALAATIELIAWEHGKKVPQVIEALNQLFS